jgi:SAM-dependent methyltransferase
VERLQQRYPDRSNLHPFVCDAAAPEFSTYARFEPDSCVCLNVLEHIEDDQRALAAMASILMPGGVIVLLTPAFPALYGPIDRNLGHWRRYTRASLASLAGRCGLTIAKLRYVNAIGLFGWWANSHVFRREAQSERQIEIFDRYLVPVMSRLESVAPPPFGQSLFATLRKP